VGLKGLRGGRPHEAVRGSCQRRRCCRPRRLRIPRRACGSGRAGPDDMGGACAAAPPPPTAAATPAPLAEAPPAEPEAPVPKAPEDDVQGASKTPEQRLVAQVQGPNKAAKEKRRAVHENLVGSYLL
ncbi:unnamed protein product, partial [Effrenium voratum]